MCLRDSGWLCVMFPNAADWLSRYINRDGQSEELSFFLLFKDLRYTRNRLGFT